MQEITQHKWLFDLIPDPADQLFFDYVNKWYEDVEVPIIKDGLVYDYETSAGGIYFHEFLLELAEYEFTHQIHSNVDPHEFPKDITHWGDSNVDLFNQTYTESFHDYEMRFYFDMEKYLNHFRMFFIDAFQYGPARYRVKNTPFQRVW